MIIKGEDGQSIVLRIESYEFPDSIDYNDGNWLRIYFNVKNRFGEWETIYPCLMTRDIKELITWLKNLANNIEPKWRDQEFLEPNISFYLLTTFEAEIKKIKIVLDLGTFRKEFRPIPESDVEEYSVILNADSTDLNRLANELQEDFDKYPVR